MKEKKQSREVMQVGVLKDRDSLQDLNSTVITIMHIVHFLCTEAMQL
jgi:hypothetical protein